MATNNEIDVATGATSTILAGAGVGTAPTFTATPTFTSVTLSAGTSLANFVEGTWTPTITFGGAAVGVTYTTQSGVYQRFGKTVFLYCNLVLSSKGSSTGAVQINGLPVTTKTSSNFFSMVVNHYSGLTMAAGFTSLIANTNSASTNFPLFLGGSGKTVAALSTATSTIADTFSISFSSSYLTA